MFVVYVCPFFSENTKYFIDALSRMPEVDMGIISQDPPDRLEHHLQGRVKAFYRIDDCLDTAQLTHAALGLREVADLGAWWKQETGLLLPLGLNVIRRDLDERFGEGAEAMVAGLLTESVSHARAHPDVSRRFLLARVGDRPEWRDDALVERYLGMYVNDMTTDMGEPGRAALTRLFEEASSRALCPPVGPIDLIG